MTPYELHCEIGKDAEPTDFYTERGTHEGCGQCCSRFLPLSMGEAVVLRLRAKSLDIPPQRGDYDLECPFLDEYRMCMVYDVRPAICRAYSCKEHAEGGYAALLREGLRPGMEVYDMRELIA